jgi:hypothetical protein
MNRLPIRRMTRGPVLAAIAVLVAGCAPYVSIHNGTTFAVRVVITTSEGSQVFSPSPGEDSTADATEGTYTVTVVPDAEWITWAKATRAYLNERIANSESLTGPQLLDVVQRLKDIAAKMQSYANASGGSAAGCGGTVTANSDGLVTITQAADGTLVATCR